MINPWNMKINGDKELTYLVEIFAWETKEVHKAAMREGKLSKILDSAIALEWAGSLLGYHIFTEFDRR